MLTADGPKLIEYNVRFGDPECEAIMPLIEGDFAELLHAVATGRLAEIEPPRSFAEARDDGDRRRAGATPARPRAADSIRAIEAAEQVEGVTVFHAGTALDDGGLVAKGGRVLAVTAVADTFRQRARARLSRGRPDRLRRRLPSPRHRLARARSGKVHERALGLISGRSVAGLVAGVVAGICRIPSCGQARKARLSPSALAAAIGAAALWHGPLGRGGPASPSRVERGIARRARSITR